MFELKPLESCSVGSLIRINLEETEWAVLGASVNHQMRPLLILGNRPRWQNISDNMDGIDSRIANSAVADYGNGFHIDAVHRSSADVNTGDLFSTPGSLAMANDGVYIVCENGNAPFFGIGQWRPLATIHRDRIAFSAWHIYLKKEDKQPLISFPFPE